MNQKSARFWLALAVFQVVFAALIFGATRAYYTRDAATLATAVNNERAEEAAPAWPGSISPELIATLTPGEPIMDDPAALSHMAEQAFASEDYAKASEYYRRLLGFDPDNADVRNNLGLTLQYTGRTSEALAELSENVSRHPGHQRSWLTLGFINRQAGDITAARSALTTAISIDPTSDIGRSAQAMLDSL